MMHPDLDAGAVILVDTEHLAQGEQSQLFRKLFDKINTLFDNPEEVPDLDLESLVSLQPFSIAVHKKVIKSVVKFLKDTNLIHLFLWKRMKYREE